MIGLVALAAVVAAAGDPAGSFLGTFTSEEAVYFAKDKGGTPPPWLGVEFAAAPGGARVRTVDAYGKPGGEDQIMSIAASKGGAATSVSGCRVAYARNGETLKAIGRSGTCTSPGWISAVGPKSLTLTLASGQAVELQRARPFDCWVSMKKAAKKADGSEDWSFDRVKLHDAGGRAAVTVDGQTASLRMRNVAWPSGPNRPSLVLYVHKDDPDHAVSYSWADPEAKRVGLNLRWMQASCTLSGSGA